jgi:hypothetical protein
VWLLPVLAVGWMDLLRRSGLLGFGPLVGGALPLEQLAREDAQPLARVVVAWVPAGLLAGALLARRPPVVRALVVAVVFWVVLVTVGAMSDAAAISESIQSHVPAQLSRAGTWVEVGIGALTAMVPPAGGSRRDAHASRA